MQVARLHGVGDIRVGDEAVPEPGPDEELVRVTAVGICGSDLHWWDQGGIGDAQLARPLVLGHEGAGVIADGPRRGERVAIDPAIPCGVCRPCRDGYRNLCPRIRFAGHGGTDGAMREFMSWPAELLYPLPEELSDADGAVLEPLGVALHSYDLGHLRLGGTAAVIGCGPIGLLLIQSSSCCAPPARSPWSRPTRCRTGGRRRPSPARPGWPIRPSSLGPAGTTARGPARESSMSRPGCAS